MVSDAVDDRLVLLRDLAKTAKVTGRGGELYAWAADEVDRLRDLLVGAAVAFVDCASGYSCELVRGEPWAVEAVELDPDLAEALASVCDETTGWHDDGDPMLCTLPSEHDGEHSHHGSGEYVPGEMDDSGQTTGGVL